MGELSFNLMNFVDNLKYLGLGMLGIGLVIGVIIIVTMLITKVATAIEDKKEEK